MHSAYSANNDKAYPPEPCAPAELIRTRISATQYQSLMDCPYQYFAKYVLCLREQDTADDFEASDYGVLVHQSLYEFHFNETRKVATTFTNEQSHTLIDELSDLSTTIFMRAPFPTIIKQGWLQRWLKSIPSYIQWTIERAKEWRTLRGEALIQTPLDKTFTLYGQIDRIDSDTQQLAVIDYKTGSSKPTKKRVMSGELVQLPFYALLDENITQAEYLNVGSQSEVRSNATLNKEELTSLKEQHKPRLKQLLNALVNQAKLGAQGDEQACRICDYQGLCRKQHWN